MNRAEIPSYLFDIGVIEFLLAVYNCHIGPGRHGSYLEAKMREIEQMRYPHFWHMILYQPPVNKILTELVDLGVIEYWGRSHPLKATVGMTGGQHRAGMEWGICCAPEDFYFQLGPNFEAFLEIWKNKPNIGEE